MLNKSQQSTFKNSKFIELGLGSSFSYLTYLSNQSALTISNIPLQISLAIGALTGATLGIENFSSLLSKKTIFKPIIKKLFDNYEKNLNHFIEEKYYKDLPSPETHEEKLERIVVKDFILYMNSFETNGLVGKKFINIDEYYQFKEKLCVVFKDLKEENFLKNTFLNASASHSFSTEYGIETMFNKTNVEPFIIALDLFQGKINEKTNQEIVKMLEKKEFEIKNPEMIQFLSQDKVFSNFNCDMQACILKQLNIFKIKEEKLNKLNQIHQHTKSLGKDTHNETNLEDILLIKSVEKNIHSLYGEEKNAQNLCSLLNNTHQLREDLISFFKDFNLQEDVSYLNIKMFLEHTLDNTLMHMNRELNLLQKMNKLKSNRFDEKKEIIFKSMCDRIKKLNEKLNEVSEEISKQLENELDYTHEVNKNTMKLRGI